MVDDEFYKVQSVDDKHNDVPFPLGTLCVLSIDIEAFLEPATIQDHQQDWLGPQVELFAGTIVMTVSGFNRHKEIQVITKRETCFVPFSCLTPVNL